MTENNYIVVKLDNATFGGGPGTVVARVTSVREYLVMVTDRDGAHDRNYRLWRGSYAVGARVSL